MRKRLRSLYKAFRVCFINQPDGIPVHSAWQNVQQQGKQDHSFAPKAYLSYSGESLDLMHLFIFFLSSELDFGQLWTVNSGLLFQTYWKYLQPFGANDCAKFKIHTPWSSWGLAPQLIFKPLPISRIGSCNRLSQRNVIPCWSVVFAFRSAIWSIRMLRPSPFLFADSILLFTYSLAAVLFFFAGKAEIYLAWKD